MAVRLSGLSLRWQAATALLAGAALPSAFAPLGWWPLSLLAPAVLMALWSLPLSPRRAALLGGLSGVGTFSVGTWWLVISIHGFGQAPLAVALLLLGLLVLVMSAYYAALGYALRRWFRPQVGWGTLLVMPAAWLLAEWLRGWFLSGFPWLSLGYAHTDSPLAGFAPLLGVYGVSLLVLVVAGGMVTALLATARGWRAAGLACAVLPWLAGAGLARLEWTTPQGEAFPVALLQGAIPQDQKWLDGNLQTTLDLYQRLHDEALGARLIVWPEAAIPDLVNQQTRYVSRQWTVARQAGSAVVMGVVRVDDDGETYYNSIVSLVDEPVFYDKDHLVPFGEYFPVPGFVRRWLRMMDLPYSDFARGGADQPPLPGGGGLLLSASLCYEDAYPTPQLRTTRASDLLVNVTNDAWFGKAGARYQHFQIARMRAIESRRYMLRAANDGLTAVVGPQGEVLAQAPQFQPAVLKTTVQARRGSTPWLLTGNWPVLGFTVAVLAVALWRQRRRPVGA